MGFIPSLACSLAIIALLFTINNIEILLLLASVFVVAAIMAIIVAFIRLRAFIALGIITVLVATPLLLIGSCFAFTPEAKAPPNGPGFREI